ncbi:MAG TPA: amidohydrolase family protein [Beijerinckiaceae bacterium]|nr:amidohydrolase family protein [Beijerinckiaceae bacterium]
MAREPDLEAICVADVEEAREAPIEPGLPIIDPHHHLRDRQADHFRASSHYLLPELLRDMDSGHNIRATVVVECSAMYKADGPPELRPVGETEFLNGIAAMSASGGYGSTRVCAGIVGFADMRLGERVRPVLEAHVAAGGGRFRGIRNQVSWDEHDGLKNLRGLNVPHALLDPDVRAGVGCLASLDLSLDIHCHFTQLGDVLDLATAVPQVNIVLNHTGGPVHIGPYAGRHAEVFDRWKKGMQELARCPNVVVKLGALARVGFDTKRKDAQPMSEHLAALWRPYIETSIELFGAERCMFESNFPPDRKICAYGILWNAFKRIAAQYTASEKVALFSGTATAAYRLPAIRPGARSMGCSSSHIRLAPER